SAGGGAAGSPVLGGRAGRTALADEDTEVGREAEERGSRRGPGRGRRRGTRLPVGGSGPGLAGGDDGEGLLHDHDLGLALEPIPGEGPPDGDHVHLGVLEREGGAVAVHHERVDGAGGVGDERAAEVVALLPDGERARLLVAVARRDDVVPGADERAGRGGVGRLGLRLLGEGGGGGEEDEEGDEEGAHGRAGSREGREGGGPTAGERCRAGTGFAVDDGGATGLALPGYSAPRLL